MPIVAFFGSSKSAPDSQEYIAAEQIASLLAQSGFDIMTGSYGGIMQAALKGAMAHDVKRIGVATSELSDRKSNEFVSYLITKPSYIERLIELTLKADAFVVFPGGTGTLAELSIIWALKERKIFSNKPVVCYGDQWNEVHQIMSFYSETVVDNSGVLFNTCDVNEAANYILESFK
jgi:uncharacterized protein (TIGR00730 family)